MKVVTCQCGHQEMGATEKDALSKMQSHIHNAHGGRPADVKKRMKAAQSTVHDGVAQM